MHHYYLFHSEKKQNNFGTVFELFITFVPIGNTNWVTCVPSWAIFCLGFVYFEIFQEFVQKRACCTQSVSAGLTGWDESSEAFQDVEPWEGGGEELNERERNEKPLLTCSLHTQLPTETIFLLSFSPTGVTNTWDWEQQRKKRRARKSCLSSLFWWMTTFLLLTSFLWMLILPFHWARVAIEKGFMKFDMH